MTLSYILDYEIVVSRWKLLLVSVNCILYFPYWWRAVRKESYWPSAHISTLKDFVYTTVWIETSSIILNVTGLIIRIKYLKAELFITEVQNKSLGIAGMWVFAKNVEQKAY